MKTTTRPLGICLVAFLLLAAACTTEDAAPRDPCEVGFSRCGELCVDLESDAAHCGACDLACAEGHACEGSLCVLDCPAETIACGGACVNFASDPENCGSCGSACGEDEVCSQGNCQADCATGETLCGNSCVDVGSDLQNCGACGVVCEVGEACVAGACVIQCDEGEEICEGSCVDTSQDVANCGACGKACGENESCAAGDCICTFAVCGGACTDTENDAANCGDCGIACDGGPRVVGASCDAGACSLACEADYGDCDDDADTGCETLLINNQEHCGACGNNCDEAANVDISTCNGDFCLIHSCQPNWGDCDTEPGNGCETDLLTDLLNCGGCAVECAALAHNIAAPACNDGVCDLSCAEGWDDCDKIVENGCETDLMTDNGNCGGCGIVCEGHDTCNDGVCFDRQWAQWPMPSDLPEDYITDAEAGTVTDLVTGLIWERKPLAVPMELEEGKAYCRDLTLAGKSDWRLPTIIELTSILHLHEHFAPSLHLEHFKGAPHDHTYQTSTPHAGPEASSWQLDFKWGVLESYNNRKHYVRCVRGGKGDDGPRFVVQGDTVIAPKNHLMWQRSAPTSPLRTAAEGIEYCEDLVLAGHSDWRLPTMKELLTLVDRRVNTQTYEPEIFPDMGISGIETFYASTSIYRQPGTAQTGNPWHVDFFNGTNTYADGPTFKTRVRCVRDHVPTE